MSELDIKSNRSAQKYAKSIQIRRVAWMFGALLFKMSFRTMFGWRSALLRLFGAKVGRDVHIYNSATIYMPWNLEIGDYSAIGEHAYIYNLGKVSIGSRTTISHRAHLCAGTHDYEQPSLPLLKPAIVLGDQVWVCADAFVGPGIQVGTGAVVGARAVAMKDISAWEVVAGNPAKKVAIRNIEQESM